VKLSPHLLEFTPRNVGTADENKTEVQQLGVADLFRDPTVRKITLIMFFNWIVVTLGI
jgi:hypothetical protein